MRSVWYAFTLLACGLIVGCSGEEAPPPTSTTSQAPAPPAPAPPGKPAPSAEDAAAAPEVEAAAPEAATETPAAETPAEAPPAEPTAGAPTTPAQVGVGVKGSNYGGPGLVTTPVEAYFRTGERIAFEIQIPSAMKLYKAAHDNKGPKTHEEFMNVIIKENGVQLPELPEGEEFVYDPKTEQLMVRHPAK